jgi:hypothetical protein
MPSRGALSLCKKLLYTLTQWACRMRCPSSFLLLIAIVLSASFAYADKFEVMDYYGKAGQVKCYSNGQAVIPFTQFKGTVPLPGFIQEIAIKTGYDTYQSIRGKYYDREYKRINSSGSGDTVLFISDEYIFNDKKKYAVVMAGVPYELINLYEDVSVLTFNFSCPGYLHSCRYLDLRIDSCVVDKEYITVDFHGLGTMNYSEVNLTRDVGFTLNSESYPTESDKITIPLTTEYFDMGNDSFQLRIPREDANFTIKGVSAEVKGCLQEIYRVKASRDCIVKKPVNRSVFAKSEVEYECAPKQNQTEPTADNICSRVVALPPEKPPVPPDRIAGVLDFLRRIVRFVITIPAAAK